jgi:hypothetical protein
MLTRILASRRLVVRFPISLIVLTLAAAGLRGAPPDLAELFPAGTLTYIEVNQPAAVAGEIAGLLKGTALEDSIATVSKLREKSKDQPIDTSHLGVLGTLLGPEMLAEAKRFDAFAVGITGFSKAHEPEYAGLLLAGSSHVPGLLLRSYLTSVEMRKVGTAEGIDLYQEMAFAGPPDGLGLVPTPPAAPVVAAGLVFGYSDGRLLFASNKEAMTALIRRWKGKDQSGSLARMPPLVEARGVRQRPGLFVYADLKNLIARIDASQPAQGEAGDLEWELFKGIVNPKALGSLVAHLGFDKRGYAFDVQLRLERSQPSPLFDLLSDAKVTTTMPTGADATFGMTFAPPTEQRSERLLRLADAAVKATGTLGVTPREAVRELDEQTRVPTATNVLDKLRGISLLLPHPRQWPKEGNILPVIVLHMDDEAAARAAEGLVPPLLRLLGADSIEPTTETIAGQKVRSISGRGLPWGTPLHFGSRGATFACGQDRALLASALAGADKPVALPPELSKDACVVAVCGWGIWSGRPPPPEEAPPPERPRVPPPTIPVPLAEGPQGNLREGARQTYDELVRSIEKLPPLLMSARRDGDMVRIELRQPDPRQPLRRVIDKCVEWLGQSPESSLRRLIIDGASGVGGGPIIINR